MAQSVARGAPSCPPPPIPALTRPQPPPCRAAAALLRPPPPLSVAPPPRCRSSPASPPVRLAATSASLCAPPLPRFGFASPRRRCRRRAHAVAAPTRGSRRVPCLDPAGVSLAHGPRLSASGLALRGGSSNFARFCDAYFIWNIVKSIEIRV